MDAAVLNALKALTPAISDEALGRAVRELLAKEGGGRQPGGQERLVTLKVRTASGEPTCVSVPKALMDAASRALGSEEAARVRIRELAKQAPAGVRNRSGWIQDNLLRQVGVRHS
jgi:hypothetical protein